MAKTNLTNLNNLFYKLRWGSAISGIRFNAALSISANLEKRLVRLGRFDSRFDSLSGRAFA
jgi:hypothetical protein